MGRSRKPLSGKAGPRVRIPPSPDLSDKGFWKYGEVTERPKVHDWKSCVLLTGVPRVRIPPSPLIKNSQARRNKIHRTPSGPEGSSGRWQFYVPTVAWHFNIY